MDLPDSVRAQVETTLEQLGIGSGIASSTAVGGGCISNGARLDTHDGERYFLKWNTAAPSGMFAAESAGLNALRDAAELRVPERLGRGLARIHSSGTSATFGFDHDNWIGALPQTNEAGTSWAIFWRDQRVIPQLELARTGGHLSDPIMDRLVEVIPAALEGTGRPELLHGDLWSGNAYFGEDGTPVLIDPAVYRGDGEVDLAMSELFGGFGRTFYEAYRDVRPVSLAYEHHRRDLYQLYYLLVHVNLFGASYVASSLAAARRVVAEID